MMGEDGIDIIKKLEKLEKRINELEKFEKGMEHLSDKIGDLKSDVDKITDILSDHLEGDKYGIVPGLRMPSEVMCDHNFPLVSTTSGEACSRCGKIIIAPPFDHNTTTTSPSLVETTK